MTFLVMVARHPYRTSGKPEVGAPRRERTSLWDLDAEIVIFLWSMVVLVVGIFRWELGAAQALAILAAIFSGRHLVRAALGRRR